MVLESPDGLLGGVPAVHMRRNQVDSALVGCDGRTKGGTDFIVHGVFGWGVVDLPEPIVDGLVGSYAVDILFGGKGLHEDGIAAVYCHHDVLITTAGTCGKAACVICENAGYRYIQECDVSGGIGWCNLRCRRKGCGARLCSGGGGSCVLVRLCHVPKVCLSGVWAIAGS